MAFVYEQARKEDAILWHSIKFRQWGNQLLGFTGKEQWFCDRERGIYVLQVGSFRGDTPYYIDMSYKNRIIRMDVEKRMNYINENGSHCIFEVQAIRIPKSVWNDKEDIINAIKEAFSVYRNEWIISSEAVIDCEAECVEKDYNGK